MRGCVLRAAASMSGRCGASAGFVGVAAGESAPPPRGDVVVGRVAALALRGAVGVLALLGAGVLLVSPVSGQSAAAPEITSPGPFEAAEGTTSVATLTASDDDTAEADLVWSTAGGADVAEFTLSESGVLAFGAAPDYEQPDDSDTDGAYEVTVQVSDGVNAADTPLSVTVTVSDVDEDGTVSLATKRPRTGTAVTATLVDPDDVVAGSATWVWQRSAGYNDWVVIAGADSSSYTPAAADAGSFLRAGVTYSDRHGSGAQAQATAPEVVAADQLSALSISTNDSAATTYINAWRRMRPAFDAQTLHYSAPAYDVDGRAHARSGALTYDGAGPAVAAVPGTGADAAAAGSGRSAGGGGPAWVSCRH